MARAGWGVILLALSACSTTLPDRCDRVWTTAGRLEQCSEAVDTPRFALAMPEIVADVDEWLPGTAEIAEDLEVRVYTAEPGAKVAGQYMGYDPSDNAIELFIWPEGNLEARFSAYAHELAHAWEHQVMMVSYVAWVDCEEHFCYQELIEKMLADVTAVESEAIRCLPL